MSRTGDEEAGWVVSARPARTLSPFRDAGGGMTLLNIGLVVLATLLGVVLLFWCLLRYALPWWLKRKLAALAAMPDQPGIAARISLVPDAAPFGRPETEAAIALMRDAGFFEVGRYAVPEMPGMRLWAAHHPGDGLAAAVYDHTTMPTFFDVVRVAEDHSTCTVSTNPIHDPDNVPPGSRCIADPTLSPMQALALIRGEAQQTPQLRVDAGNFEPVFIELYARSIDHILGRGVPDAEKMREVGERVAIATGEPMPQLDERQMAMAVDMERASRLAALEQAIIDRFLQSGQIDAREWERVRDQVSVVHDLLSREDAADLARSRAGWDATQPLVDAALAQPLSAFETFERVSESLPVQQRVRVLGEVDHPLYAQILVSSP
jgi:hypothetical protein